MSNTQAQSPLDHFLEWFFSLPSTHQSHIATAAHFMPGFAIDLGAPEAATRFPELFANSVRQYKSAIADERGAATVLHCSLETQAMDGLGEGKWRDVLENRRRLNEKAGEELLSTNISELQAADAEWAATRKSWNDFKNGAFSLHTIKYHGIG